MCRRCVREEGRGDSGEQVPPCTKPPLGWGAGMEMGEAGDKEITLHGDDQGRERDGEVRTDAQETPFPVAVLSFGYNVTAP